MSLLPSRPDTSPPEDAGPRVIGVDSDDADEVLSALSSETARELLSAVHEEPAPPSDLADRVDTSLQNAQYHLQNLQEAGAIEVVDTAYSAKGREMDVYAPSDQPLVIFAGDESEGSTLRTALARLLGAVGLLAAGSLVVQAVFGGGLSELVGLGGEGGRGAPQAGGGSAAPQAGADSAVTQTPTPRPPPAGTEEPTMGALDHATETPEAAMGALERATDTPIQTATETATNLTTESADAARTAVEAVPPGLAFFAGGLFALVVVGGVWYLRTR